MFIQLRDERQPKKKKPARLKTQKKTVQARARAKKKKKRPAGLKTQKGDLGKSQGQRKEEEEEEEEKKNWKILPSQEFEHAT